MSNYIFRESACTRPIIPVRPVELGRPSSEKSRLEERAKQYASHNGDPRSFRMSQRRNQPTSMNGSWMDGPEIDVGDDEEEDNDPEIMPSQRIESPRISPFSSPQESIRRGGEVRFGDPRIGSWQPIPPNQNEDVMQSRMRAYGFLDDGSADPAAVEVPPVRTSDAIQEMQSIRRTSAPRAAPHVIHEMDHEVLGILNTLQQPRESATVHVNVERHSPQVLAELASTVWADATTTPSVQRGTLLQQYTRMIRGNGHA